MVLFMSQLSKDNYLGSETLINVHPCKTIKVNIAPPSRIQKYHFFFKQTFLDFSNGNRPMETFLFPSVNSVGGQIINMFNTESQPTLRSFG